MLQSKYHIPRTISFIFILLLTTVFAQERTGSITGKISDELGNVIAGAKIIATLQTTTSAHKRVSIVQETDSEGEFTFSGLPTGRYQIAVESFIFTHKPQEVQVIAGQSLTLDLRLSVKSACADGSGPNLRLSRQDKKTIIRWVLNKIIEEDDGTPVVLSIRNINSSWVAGFPKSKVVVVSGEKLEGEQKPEVFYWYFSDFAVQGDCVAVTLTKASTRHCTLCGSGQTYIFHKVAGRWKGKFFSGWIA